MFHAQLHQGADKSAVVPCMLQVCMVACLAPFCHVQAHFVDSAFSPVFLLFHFWAVCGQFFFSMALFESCGTSCTGNVLNHSPKPKATCPPMVWWLSILIGFAPLCRGGVHHACKGGAHGGSCCGMFKVPESQIPQQAHVPCGWCWGAHNVAEGCGPIMAGLWPAVAGPQSTWPGCGPLCF